MATRLVLLLLAACVVFGPLPAPAQQTPPSTPSAAPPPAAELTPAEARRAIELLQDPQQRARLIEMLRAFAAASPAAAGPPAATVPAAAAAPPPAAPVALAPDSLGAQLVAHLLRWPGRLADEAAATVRTVADLPSLWRWAERLARDPHQRASLLDALWRFAVILAAALLLEAAARYLAARPIARLETQAPPAERDNGVPEAAEEPGSGRGWRLLRRLPFALARLALELIPVGIFWTAGSLLAGPLASPPSRAAVLIGLNAYVTVRLVMCFGRLLLSPEAGGLRLLHVGDAAAGLLTRALRQITIVIVAGGALAGLAVLLGLDESAGDALLRLAALIVAVQLAVLVWRTRDAVAMRLRPAGEPQTGIGHWRSRLAAVWHHLALFAIAAGFVLWVAGVRNGLDGLRLVIGTVAIVAAARLAAIVGLGTLDRLVRPAAEAGLPAAVAHAARYHGVARLIIDALVALAAVIALLEFWGADAFRWFQSGHIGARLVSALATVLVAAVIAIAVWESVNAALERRLARLSAAGLPAHAVRLRTMLPMLRATLFAVILTVVGLTALSELGVNIAPLLAGAGIAGVAIGFGAQKLVQDVITGMFVLLENTIQIGDGVTVAGLSGRVEQLSLRNIWLRGGDGAVHIIPFSAVTSITNANRGRGNAAASVTIAPTEDSDRAAEALREIAAELRRDPEFEPLILSDLELWVDSVKATGTTFAGQIPCTDAGRLPVQREFARRLQRRFRELGIELGSG